MKIVLSANSFTPSFLVCMVFFFSCLIPLTRAARTVVVSSVFLFLILKKSFQHFDPECDVSNLPYTEVHF
jgi:hypothetical protein